MSGSLGRVGNGSGFGLRLSRFSPSVASILVFTMVEVYVTESPDLTTLLNLHTIIPLYPNPEIEVDDFIFRNTGATEDSSPMELSAEKFQVKGFGE